MSFEDAREKTEDWRRCYNELPAWFDRPESADSIAEIRWHSRPAIVMNSENSTPGDPTLGLGAVVRRAPKWYDARTKRGDDDEDAYRRDCGFSTAYCLRHH
jgi:hypothetical protein